MEPVKALGVAAAAVQFSDFSIKTVRLTRDIYKSASDSVLSPTISLAHASLDLLMIQQRLLLFVDLVEANSNTNDHLELTAARAAVAISIVLRDCLKRAIVASKKKKMLASTREPEEHRELQELLQNELIPLIQKHEVLLHRKYAQDNHATFIALAARERSSQDGDTSSTQMRTIEPFEFRGRSNHDTSTVQRSDFTLSSQNELQNRSEVRSSSEACEPDHDASESDTCTENDLASLYTLEANTLGIPGLDFHRQRVVKRLTIFGNDGNCAHTCEVLLDTGSSLNLIDKKLKQRLATHCTLRKAAKARSARLADGTVRRVKTVVEIDWSFSTEFSGEVESPKKKYRHGFFSFENPPYELIVGRSVIFEFGFLCENLDICPLGLPQSEAEDAEALVLGLARQERAVAEAQKERARLQREANAKQRDDDQLTAQQLSNVGLSAPNEPSHASINTQSSSSTNTGSSVARQ